MDTNINFKNAMIALGASILLFITGAIPCQATWLTTIQLLAAITALAIGGAFFIKATWIRNDENRDKKHWSILDARLLN